MKLMINIINIVPDFIKRLAENDYFDEIKLIRAYPNTFKPTRMKQAVIAVSTIDVQANNMSLGQSAKQGVCSVQASVYVPFSMDGSVAQEAVQHICNSVSDMNTISISVSETTADSTTECYITKAVFTFRNEFDFNEEENE